jgi:DNA modification methylase
MTIRILVGDCCEVMATMDEDSVDAIVTDPPYGLEFMGKEWDRLGAIVEYPADGEGPWGRQNRVRSRANAVSMQAWHETWARQAYRVLKPGGHLLAFGGTRTSHRLMVAIEDAGFEIRDCLMWLYGSGFPKSLDVSKAIDKAAGAERDVVSRTPTPFKIDKAVSHRGTWNASTDGSLRGQHDENGYYYSEQTAPATDLARQWDGWGTALKPAYEPIVMARKPLIGSVAANVERYGTGGINVDGCRIETDEVIAAHHQTGGSAGHTSGVWNDNYQPGQAGQIVQTNGRWPANVLLDEEAAALLDAQSGEWSSGKMQPTHTNAQRNVFGQNANGGYVTMETYGDTGGASRFFYTAKASRSERNKGLDGMPEVIAGAMQANRQDGVRVDERPGRVDMDKAAVRAANHHPTVKPLDLMQWLVRLVTPPGGTVLDCFCGSGTTLIAADREGFDAIGIEQDAEYAEIARRRCIGDAPLFAQVAD